MGSSETTEIVAIRHGQTVWNVEERIQGHGDSPLTELGLRQAQAIAASFVGERLDRIYSSDLPRALRTAEVIGGRDGRNPVPIIVDVRLRERDHGIFEGLTLAEIEARYPEELALFRIKRDPDFAIPGGESLRGFSRRAIECFEEIARASPGMRVAVVTHGGVIESLIRHALGHDLGEPMRFKVPNGSRSFFVRSGGGWALATWGDVRHLAGLGPAR